VPPAICELAPASAFRRATVKWRGRTRILRAPTQPGRRPGHFQWRRTVRGYSPSRVRRRLGVPMLRVPGWGRAPWSADRWAVAGAGLLAGARGWPSSWSRRRTGAPAVRSGVTRGTRTPI